MASPTVTNENGIAIYLLEHDWAEVLVDGVRQKPLLVRGFKIFLGRE